MSENAWDEREKELKERLNYAHEHNSSDEVILATRLLQFQSCRSLHESDLKRLFDEIEKCYYTTRLASRPQIDLIALEKVLQPLKKSTLGEK